MIDGFRHFFFRPTHNESVTHGPRGFAEEKPNPSGKT